MNTALNLGFIGLGIMGAPMAGHLRRAGYTLFVNTRSAVSPELLAAGVTVCASAQAPAKVRRALMGGFASSRILEVHGERMIKRTFNPGFRIALHQKDLNLALQSAKALNMALPQTAGAAQLMQTCAALGHGQLDHSALVKALEVMAQHPVAPDA